MSHLQVTVEDPEIAALLRIAATTQELFAPAPVRGYYISTRGRVRTDDHDLKPYIDGAGYQTVTLIDGKTRRQINVHRLMGIVFLGVKPGQHVHHRDGDPLNNTIANLEVVDPREHAQRTMALNQTARGSRHGCAKLTETNVRSIRSLRGKLTADRLAKRFRVSRNTIHRIWRGETWRHV